MSTENSELIDFDLKDILQESINIGLGKAANVIAEIADSSVALDAVRVYLASGLDELPQFSDKIIVQEMKGDDFSGKTVFSMGDEELIKLIKYLENIDEIYGSDEQILEMILDTYQEIGNIILGNTISSIVDFLKIRAEIKVPYISDNQVFDMTNTSKYLVVDVMFKIDKLDANGKLCLVNDYNTYEAMLAKSKEI